MHSMNDSDPLLSELCSICHTNPPKYRCPRCSTRTCSLPCTKRHKLWSQCSGVRDPGTYLRRSELATASTFDRDFNFITGIERSMERAERDVENRGIDLARGQVAESMGTEETAETGTGGKRKYPGQGLVKGEAGFLRGAEAGGVKVLRAPRGMTRNKENSSRWHPKHKCLTWIVEWIPVAGERTLRNCLETCSIAEAYDQVFPLPKQYRSNVGTSKPEKGDQQEQNSTRHEQRMPSDAVRPDGITTAASTGSPNTTTVQSSTSETGQASTRPSQQTEKPTVVPHRDLYFYLHRPRTTTKKPVVVPLSPSMSLTVALRERIVLEFPTIYLLPESPEELLADRESSDWILEEEYLRTAALEETADQTAESRQGGTESEPNTGLPASSVNLEAVDENKVMEVLKQDLFESVPDTEQTQS